jgi:hypothetical protein
MTITNQSESVTRHRRFQKELARFALGEFLGQSRETFLRHLDECPQCRRDLSDIRLGMFGLCLTITGPVPPKRGRARLLAAL